ncbi:MAG TPA: exodeoxyribonuclease VII small subunit [Anaerolineales bacterium]|nr:exodeoxyribonuclease VII small subunit [Anaerolineales bacterium]
MTSPFSPPVDELTYEEAFQELEMIVAALEEEDHPLEEALARFERGQALARRCAVLLDQAELRIQQVTNDQISDFEA